MLQIDYTDLIKKSWQLTWKNRFLWKFGFILALAGIFANLGRISDISKNDGVSSIQQQAIINFVQANLGWIIGAAGIIFVIYLAIIFLSIVARAGLIKSLEDVFTEKKVSFLSGMGEGKRFFWKMLGLKLSLGIFIIISLLILSIPVIILAYYGDVAIAILLGIAALVIFFSILIISAFLNNFGQMYIVLGNIDILPALENSYALFRKYLSSNLILLLIFIPIGIVISIVSFLVLIIVAAVFAPIGFILYYLIGKIGAAFAIIFGGLIILAAILAIQSVVQVFLQTFWLLYFHEIAKQQNKELISDSVKETEEKKSELSETNPVMRTEEGAETEEGGND